VRALRHQIRDDTIGADYRQQHPQPGTSQTLNVYVIEVEGGDATL
jgi:hypothetical protein